MFPFLDYKENQSSNNENYPDYTEIMWNTQTNTGVFDNSGNPVLVTGVDAIISWCFRALLSERFLYEIFSKDYGSEIDSLINTKYNELAKAEASRYIKECLIINPYIKDIYNIEVDFSESELIIKADIDTVYGNIELKVGE